jgi:hypothetical protein
MAGGMITSWPGRQFTGVATECFAVSWHESNKRSTSSKLRPVLMGYVSIALIFLSGPSDGVAVRSPVFYCNPSGCTLNQEPEQWSST